MRTTAQLCILHLVTLPTTVYSTLSVAMQICLFLQIFFNHIVLVTSKKKQFAFLIRKNSFIVDGENKRDFCVTFFLVSKCFVR